MDGFDPPIVVRAFVAFRRIIRLTNPIPFIFHKNGT